MPRQQLSANWLAFWTLFTAGVLLLGVFAVMTAKENIQALDQMLWQSLLSADKAPQGALSIVLGNNNDKLPSYFILIFIEIL